jgi:hypothetical protein
MPSSIIRVSDLSGIAVDANVFLPSPSMGASSSDPNSKWWASGLLAVTSGRCVLYTDPSLFNQVSTSTIPLDGGPSTDLDDGSSGSSQDVSLGSSQDVSSGGSGDTSVFTPRTLALCRPDAPYYAGIRLYTFYGLVSTYPSGTGFLYQSWAVPGGLAAGQVTWVLTSTS